MSDVSARSPDVTWHAGELTREERWRALGVTGATLWFTGLPASGKSAIASAVEQTLVHARRPAYVIDGDNVRHGLSGDLGFGPAARRENVRRVADVARMFADAGVVALVSLVSPFTADRRLAREIHAAHGVRFLEVYVDTPADVCAQRDPKGLYARAHAGELRNFTGVDAPYEPPEAAELVIAGSGCEVGDGARAVLAALEELA
jgi:adenylyl-sulfate kinase